MNFTIALKKNSKKSFLTYLKLVFYTSSRVKNALWGKVGIAIPTLPQKVNWPKKEFFLSYQSDFFGQYSRCPEVYCTRRIF